MFPRAIVLLFLASNLPDGGAQEGVVLTVMPTESPHHRQIETAIVTAVQELNTNLSAKHRLTVKHDIAFNASRSAFDQLSVALGQTAHENVVAVMGLSAGFLIELVGAVTGALSVPAIATGIFNRQSRNAVYYPSLFHAAPADDGMPRFLKDLMAFFGWRKFCVIYSREFSAFATLLEFVNVVAPTYNIQVRFTVSVGFTNDGRITPAFAYNLAEIQSECFVFLVGVNEHDLLPVMRGINEVGLIRSGTAWIFTSVLTGPLLLPEEVRRYMDGSLVIRPGFDVKAELRVAKKLTNISKLYEDAAEQFENVTMEAVFAYKATLQFGRAYKDWTEAIIPSEKVAGPKVVHFYKDINVPSLPNGQTLVEALKRTSLAQQRRVHSFDIFNLRDSKLVYIGNWTESGLSSQQEIRWTGKTKKIPQYEGDTLAKNTSLKLLVGLSPPFAYLEQVPETGKTRVTGIAIDLLDDIAVKAGFTYTLKVWHGDWTEMVGLAGSSGNDYEMAIGSITITKNRSRLCQFTRSYFASGLHMVIRRPKMEGGLFDFLNPFSLTVWLCLGGTIVFSAVVMQILDPNGMQAERSGHWFCNAVFFTANVFLFVHESDPISKRWAMVFLIILQFSMHILQSAYTANMASFLSSRTVESEITSYFDLNRRNVAVRRGTSNWPYVRDQLALRNLVSVKTADEAVEKLRTGEAEAYIADVPHVEKIVATYCDLKLAGLQVDPQQYAFAMKKESPWVDEVNRMIGISLANGTVTKGYKRHLKYQCTPPDPDRSAMTALNLKNLGGIFLFAGIAAVILIPLKIFRLLSMTRKRPRPPLRSISTQEVCYPMASPSPLIHKRRQLDREVSAYSTDINSVLQNHLVVPIVKIMHQNDSTKGNTSPSLSRREPW